MVIGRAARRALREPDVEALFGAEAASAALDILELTELAWHDCYHEITPPDPVINNILVCSRGDLATLARAARLAIEDSRDLQMWAADVRAETSG